MAAADDLALVVVAVGVNELLCKEEGVAEDLSTAVTIVKEKDPPYYPKI